MAKLLAFVGATVLALGVVGTALANHSWGGYHWSRSANPLTLNVGNDVNAGWDSYLNTAIADWTASDVLNLTKVAGNGSGANCSPTSGRIEVCNGAYGNTGWLGIAQVWITSGSHITQATTKINDTYFASPPYNTSSWKQLVMCQEVGHDFGLDHQDTNFNNANLGTCMDYTNVPDGPPSNLHPNAHDYAELDVIYAHLDGTSGGGKPCHGKKCPNPFDAPSFAQASKAKGDLYVDNLPNGGRRVTHVFWAPLS
jgi:hypothetical protein